MDSSNALQQALYTALVTTGRDVFDAVPDNYDVFPYITIGEDSMVDWDTKQSNGFDASVTIHTWSRENGRKECKTIQGEIYDVLHNQKLPMIDNEMLIIRRTDSTTLLDPDGETRHGVCTYRALIEQTGV